MEFPFGHHSHVHTHSHHRSDSDDDDRERSRDRDYPPPPPPFDQPPPPPPFYGGNEFAPPHPPPPNVYGYGHTPYAPPSDSYPPPGQDMSYSYAPYPPPPQHQESETYSDYPPTQQPPSSVQHVSHAVHVSHELDPGKVEETETHHSSFRPHMPSFLHQHTSNQSNPDPAVAGGGGLGSDFSNKPTVKVFCKAEPNYSLTIRDDKVILARSDPNDQYQHWYKDEKYSTRIKDEEGFPCFALVNKATGQAMKHSLGATHPVQLGPYTSERPDQTILWSMGKDLGDGYRTVRMVNNVRLNLDAFHGDKKSGGVHDGTTIVLWQWNKGDNQRWKITPY